MDESSTAPQKPGRTAVVAAFATLYLIWGSTFLGIQVAIRSFPPLLMAGFRFLLPGLVLYAVLHRRDFRLPTARQCRLALWTGALLLLGGNGLVTLGQQFVPSGRAALLIATTPLWMVLLAWLFYSGPRPGWRVVVGTLAGFGGAALLIKAPAAEAPDGVAALLGSLIILGAPVAWALGTLETRRLRPTEDALRTSALQMIAGGGLMILVGSLRGEWGVAATRAVTASSVLAFVYLAIFGALVGFSTYAWLLRVASPAALTTYAYVNPLIAVLLGWLLGGEELHTYVLLAGALILGAVLLITLAGQTSPVRPVMPAEPPSPGAAAETPGGSVRGPVRCPAGKAGFLVEGRVAACGPCRSSDDGRRTSDAGRQGRWEAK